MTLLFVAVGIAVIAGIFWVATGRLDASLPPDAADVRPDRRDGSPAFDVVVRGYRMDEVDATIADLQKQIADLSARGTKK